ncbi:hypothetical protein [Paracidovorax avenae]|uniref:hypothetical protein n=1 Tax=Paracidovorax avenae TaxID=80867 RepID=UPI003EB880B6
MHYNDYWNKVYFDVGSPSGSFRKFSAVLALILLGAVWYAITPTYKGQSISPRKVYRVEYYDASLLQRILHHEMKIPSIVRLYRIQPETLLRESAVVDLWLNGELYWWFDPPLNVVRVGRDVVFENIPRSARIAHPCRTRY